MGFPTVSEHNRTRLYHYQPFHEAHLRRLLVGHRLHFSDPRSFNDPWDCKPYFRVDHLSEPKERERLIEWYKDVTRRHGPRLPEAEIERRAAHFRAHPAELAAKVRESSRAMEEGIGEQYRIYCLTPHPDHELMWAHYARSHTGVCLEFDAAHPMISVAQAVRYSKDYPAFDMVASEDPAEVVAPLFSKSAAWAYEDEYRLVSQERAHARVGETIITDAGDCKLPAGVLKAVIVGCLADEATHSAVRNLVAEGGRDVVVKQVERARDRYQLIVVEKPGEAMIEEHSFPDLKALQAGNYRLFPAALEDSPHVFFHATHARNYDAIVSQGFALPQKTRENPFPAVSFAKESTWSLTWSMSKRAKEPGDWVVLAVRYDHPERLDDQGIDVHDRSLNPQPQIIGVCRIPSSYVHR